MSSGLQKLTDYVQCARTLGRNRKEIWQILWKETKNIRVQLGLDKHHPDQIYELHTIYGPLYFRDNFGDITNLPNLFYREVYRLKMLSQPGVILDCGANIGLAAAWFAFHNPDRQIYCFEPLPDNAAMVKRNCPTAHVEQVALGKEPSKVRLQVDDFSVMASSVDRDLKTQGHEFEVITLDSFVNVHNIEKIALVKMDTEGMELDILAGGEQTLAKAHEIAMETHGFDRHTATIDLLHQSGFELDAAEFDGETGMIFASRK